MREESPFQVPEHLAQQNTAEAVQAAKEPLSWMPKISEAQRKLFESNEPLRLNFGRGSRRRWNPFLTAEDRRRLIEAYRSIK